MENNENRRILEAIGKLTEEVQGLKEAREHETSLWTDRSEDLAELFAAMAKAQGQFKKATKENKNSYFKSSYESYGNIIDAIAQPLADNGISYWQPPHEITAGCIYLITIISHSSGQWMKFKMKINPPKNDVQSLGSYITYLSRYMLKSTLGVATQEDDDDGEAAMAANRQIYAKGPAQKAKFDPSQEAEPTVSRDQLDSLEYELSELPQLAEEIMAKMKINSLADMPKDKYQKTINWIRKYKDNIGMH